MYRAYQPTLPVTNLYLQEKWDRTRFIEHRKKVEMAACVVDTKGPQTPGHLLVNLKRNQMNNERQALVLKQNHSHSVRLGAIRRSSGQIDNWNYYTPHSLNAGQRQLKFQQLTQENARILGRILKRESEYSKWESDWETVKQIRGNISRYTRVPSPLWVAREKVPILDVRKNSGIQCVIIENETSSNQSRSTLHSISGHKRAGRSRVSSLHQDKNDHVSTKPLKISSESTDSTLETLNPETKKHRKGQKSCRCSQDNVDTSLPNSVNNINNETETQLSYKSDKRYLANEGNKTSLPHVESNRSIDFSPVASGVSSFYSLEKSEESLALTPTESSKISGKMSSLSIRVEQTDGRTHSTLQEQNRCSEKSTESLQGTNSSSQKTNRSTNVSSQGSNKSQDLSIQGRNKSPIISSQMSNSRSHSSWVGSYRNSDGSVHEIYKSTDPSLTTSSRGSSASSRYSRSIISYSDEETTNYNPTEI